MTDRLFAAIGRLRDLMAVLRSPGGCPWDAAQTPESLQRYLLEETYEVLTAIDHGLAPAIRDELGDLLLQIVFQARIFEERGAFDLADVADAIAGKLVRRHPHVFAGAETGPAEALATQWNRIKAVEREERGEEGHPAAEIPRTFPALLRARKVAEKCHGPSSKTGEQLLKAASSELALLGEAFTSGTLAKQENALGDILFTLVQLGHLHQVDSEEALRRNTDRRLACLSLQKPCKDAL